MLECQKSQLHMHDESDPMQVMDDVFLKRSRDGGASVHLCVCMSRAQCQLIAYVSPSLFKFEVLRASIGTRFGIPPSKTG